ncbi:MAG: SGNH/GDSL hydrolase family protein [Oscillochloris sp.]|nr:SGNH/GDSL hydrolase family protein [Oscillochloris sp.]
MQHKRKTKNTIQKRSTYKQNIFLYTLLILALLSCSACAQRPSPEEVSAMDMQNVATKTIFFGHQSVGWNIVNGIEEALQANPDMKLTIIKADQLAADQGPAFYHTEVGQNYDPLSKLQAFDKFIRNGIGGRADIAFFKFCYVDFNKSTDVTQLFETYKTTMAALNSAYPETTFVSMTTPLMAPDQGPKGFLKGLLGKNEELNANTRRHEFNELLRQEYAGTGKLFDLAAFEATDTNGKTCTMSVSGQTVPCLIPAYTDDGGHLNTTGRKVIAGQFLRFLATLE